MDANTLQYLINMIKHNITSLEHILEVLASTEEVLEENCCSRSLRALIATYSWAIFLASCWSLNSLGTSSSTAFHSTLTSKSFCFSFTKKCFSIILGSSLKITTLQCWVPFEIEPHSLLPPIVLSPLTSGISGFFPFSNK